MAISTRAALEAADRRETTVYENNPTLRSNSSAVMGYGSSLWTFARIPGGTGAAPGTGGAQPTKATLGAIPFENPGGSTVLYLVDWRLANVNTGRGGWLLLYDRLAHNSGFDATVTTLQDFTDLTIGRGDTTGEGVLAWMEVYTAIGTTSATLTVNYTNESGTAGRAGTLLWAPNSAFQGAAGMVRLQAGDRGVRSIQSCQWGGTGTGTAGSYGLTLARPLAWIPFEVTATPTGDLTQDALANCMVRVDADACLALLYQRAGVVADAAAIFNYTLGFVEG